MPQEDKELLLRDLCARIPYDPFIALGGSKVPIRLGYIVDLYPQEGSKFLDVRMHNAKPYLRPMSSMTEEEKHKLLKFGAVTCLENGEVVDVSCVGFERHADIQDYLNACYLDYRGLIPMNLALEAPEGMYRNV